MTSTGPPPPVATGLAGAADVGWLVANGGWYGTREEWDEIEAPLLEIDAILEEFADEYGLVVRKNVKSWPERSIVWGSGIRCIIQIFRVEGQEANFNFWLCASEDRGRARYWKTDMLVEKAPVSSFRGELPALLREGRRKLLDWSENPACMEFATWLAI